MIADFSKSFDRVAWFVDPGSRYDEDWVIQLVKWLEDWDRPVVVPARYHWIKKDGVHFWGSHMFLIGLETEDDVKEFRKTWGGYAGTGRALKEGKFVLDDPNSYREQLNWEQSLS